MKEQLFNKPILKTYRKKLRTHGTSAEATLWLRFKNKQLEGRRFRRQFSVANYILDFYCPSEKLAVELDGAHHYTDHGLEQDQIRDKNLLALGIRVLRFENKLVFDNMEGVIEEIINNFKGRKL